MTVAAAISLTQPRGTRAADTIAAFYLVNDGTRRCSVSSCLQRHSRRVKLL